MAIHSWFDSVIISLGMIGVCAGGVWLLALIGTASQKVLNYAKGRLLVRRLARMIKYSRKARMATMGKREVVEEPQGEAIDQWVAEQFAEDSEPKLNSNKPMATTSYANGIRMTSRLVEAKYYDKINGEWVETDKVVP